MLRLLIENDGVLIDEEFKDRENIIEAKMVSIDSWRVEAYKVITTSEVDDEKAKKQAKKKAFQRIIKKLKECKKILSFNDNVVAVDLCKFNPKHYLNIDKINIS